MSKLRPREIDVDGILFGVVITLGVALGIVIIIGYVMRGGTG